MGWSILRFLSIGEHKAPLKNVVSNILHTFMTQLTVIATLFGSRKSFRTKEGSVCHDWLNSPGLGADCYRLIIDPQLLQHCPDLQIIGLFDKTLEHRCQDIAPYLPARLSSPKNWTLGGRGTLTFHPSSRESCKNLGFLKIISSYFRNWIVLIDFLRTPATTC
ncbi:MAG: hypothetical protein JOS17DRAFT_752103 [Linnemannia elongata]|nr:MAG: hypothetical protein JOS17DRAFT_752103 [Linnemannia elongata]